MAIVFFLGGLVTGFYLSVVINKISNIVAIKKNTENIISIMDSGKIKKYAGFTTRDIIVILISGLVSVISFLQIGINVIFVKALVLNSILIVVSFIDMEHQIIPNKIIIFTLAMGVLFSFIDNISFISAAYGMLLGGGLLFLLALVPGALGGGDIKLMFVLGIFLGAKGILVALPIAFALASIISVVLLLFKIKKRKDQIPFGPFLALGSFIAFNFF